MKYRVFVYGTLMKGECNHYRMKDSPYLGDAVLEDYGLKETGSYPAAIPMKDFRVYGELYEVDEKIRKDLDEYEDEGELYACRKVKVDDGFEEQEVLFYEYLQDTSRMKTRLPFGKWNTYRRDLDDYVWYACYGSNINEDRFMKYIALTPSRKAPLLQESFIFDRELYFSGHAGNWEGKGVAYLDMNKEGKTFGWKYLISREQYDSVCENEGKSYDLAVEVGKDKWGIPIMTITSSKRYKENRPGKDYLEVIAFGLMKRGLFHKKEDVCAYFGMEEDLDMGEMHLKELLDRKR